MIIILGSIAITIVSVILGTIRNPSYILILLLLAPMLFIPLIINNAPIDLGSQWGANTDYNYYTVVEDDDREIFFFTFSQNGKCISIPNAYEYNYWDLKWEDKGQISITYTGDKFEYVNLHKYKPSTQTIIDSCEAIKELVGD